MDILNIKNEDGTWSAIPAITGPQGPKGKDGLNGKDGINGQDGAPGPEGPAGKDAIINGVNTLTLTQGENITLDQVGDTITISSTASGGGGVGKPGTGENAEIFNKYGEFGNRAEGEYSHAEGDSTTASSESQHVQGKWNVEDTANKYAHIVGNGTSSVRSNAHTLDWNGKAWFADDVVITGSSDADAPISLKGLYEAFNAVGIAEQGAF